MLEEYYNKKTNTLTIPFNFNEELKDLPLDTKIIKFEEDFYKEENSRFNQLVDNWPNYLTHLTFGYYFDQFVDNLPENLTHLTFKYNFSQSVDNLPLNLKQLKICETQVHYLKKIPFGCRIIDIYDNEIFVWKKRFKLGLSRSKFDEKLIFITKSIFHRCHYCWWL